MSVKNVKDCPYCFEKIQLKAIKCKHCGEILIKQKIKTSNEKADDIIDTAGSIVWKLIKYFFIGSFIIFGLYFLTLMLTI